MLVSVFVAVVCLLFHFVSFGFNWLGLSCLLLLGMNGPWSERSMGGTVRGANGSWGERSGDERSVGRTVPGANGPGTNGPWGERSMRRMVLGENGPETNGL